MNDPPKPRLVLADVDGTLVTQDKILTPATKTAARELKEAGVALAVTSGRPPRGMAMLVAPLALTGQIAGFNGGEIVNPDLSIVETHALPLAAAAQALKRILDAGLDAWIYTETDWLVRDPDAPHVHRERWTVRFDPRIVAAFTDAHLAKALKIVGVSDDLARVASCERSLQGVLGDRVSASRSQPYYLDVTHPCANKGVVLDTLAKLAQVAPSEIVTIGDMPTDVPMFQKSGFSIAMGNASEAVKAQADAIADSNENDGFAKAMRKFVLRMAA